MALEIEANNSEAVITHNPNPNPNPSLILSLEQKNIV